MTYNVFMGTLTPTQSVTHSLTHSVLIVTTVTSVIFCYSKIQNVSTFRCHVTQPVLETERC